jgi:hypothetical protein
MDTDSAIEMCICQACPSYDDCQERKAFCVTEKSKCIVEQNGCICAGCPVYSALKLSGQYYCIKGTAQQRKEVK